MIRNVLKLQKALPKYSKRVSGWTLMKLVMEKLWTSFMGRYNLEHRWV